MHYLLMLLLFGFFLTSNVSAQAQVRNGLPPTNMDSFVYEAGGYAEDIYGDEGVVDIPPFFEFDKSHRINLGIVGRRDAGITTGHGSYLPDAWGGDEWVDGPEFSQSGSTSGATQHRTPPPRTTPPDTVHVDVPRGPFDLGQSGPPQNGNFSEVNPRQPALPISTTGSGF